MQIGRHTTFIAVFGPFQQVTQARQPRLLRFYLARDRHCKSPVGVLESEVKTEHPLARNLQGHALATGQASTVVGCFAVVLPS